MNIRIPIVECLELELSIDLSIHSLRSVIADDLNRIRNGNNVLNGDYSSYRLLHIYVLAAKFFANILRVIFNLFTTDHLFIGGNRILMKIKHCLKFLWVYSYHLTRLKVKTLSWEHRNVKDSIMKSPFST